VTRVQQENQRQIVGKLLHDLRNPVHSVRISMELFGRLARRSGDVDKLMERAAVYIEPAEAAIASLVSNAERIARYVTVPGAAEMSAVPVEEVVSEVATLLRAARRRLQVTCSQLDDPGLRVRADRVRICHVLLHTCLNNLASAVTITARTGTNGRVLLEATFAGEPRQDAARSDPLSAEEVRTIVETAGGALLTASQAALSMEFTRAGDPPRG
jgi:signal transduction histidine kinase